MSYDPAIFLAAFGITTLEIVEAAAVGVALYSETRKIAPLIFVTLGIVAVFIPMFLLGALISLLPVAYVRVVGAVLLLYFGLRLIKSSRRSVLRSRRGGVVTEEFERGINATGFSVGAVEAFETAIVLVGLLPNNFDSTVLGMGFGAVLVVVAAYILRDHVRKVKQATMKIFVAALLLSFSVFWFSETLVVVSDLVLIPLFVFFAFVSYRNANRASPAAKM